MNPAALAARLVLDQLHALPPRLGDCRLACIDGPSGSGKSTVAEALTALAGDTGLGVDLVHMDDLYEGWSGLVDVAARLAEDVVAPLAHGRSGRYRRWDWPAAAWAEEREVPPTDLLVVEGVGSGTPLLAPWRSVLVWVDAPHELRRRRGLAREGDAFATYWEAWARQEAHVFARDRTAQQADVVVDGTGARPPEVR